MILSTILIPIVFILLFFTFFIVKQQSAAIVERFGKFVGIRQSGLQLKIPIVDSVAGRLSLKIQQLDVVIETKTKDDVFVRLKVSVQFKVIQDKVYDVALGKLEKDGVEISLWNSMLEIEEKVDALIKEEKFVDAMSSLANLRQPVDSFFDSVTVNVELSNKTPCLLHLVKSPFSGYFILKSFFSSLKILINDGGCFVFLVTEKASPFA